MKAKTRIFGEIEIADDKIITLEKGMIGFPDLNRFALIFDEEKQKKHNSIMWLQSMDDTDVETSMIRLRFLTNQVNDVPINSTSSVSSAFKFQLICSRISKIGRAHV